METSAGSPNENPLEAVNHPVRRIILRVFADRRRSEAAAILSPRDVADHLDFALSNVSYHMRILVTSGAITLVGTEPVRGSVRHLYKSDDFLRQRWVRDLLKAMESEDARAAVAFRED